MTNKIKKVSFYFQKNNLYTHLIFIDSYAINTRQKIESILLIFVPTDIVSFPVRYDE